MTKAATMEARRFVTMLLLAAMLIAVIPIGLVILPSGLLAAENCSVDGSFEVQSGNFTVSASIWTTSDDPVTSMTPTTEYDIKVDITYANGLDALDNVTVVLFWESDGEVSDNNTMGSDHQQRQATFEWTPTGDFRLVGPGSTTWSCDNSTEGSSVPNPLNVTNGVFEFRVTIGEVATHAPLSGTPRWFAYASATDNDASEQGSDFSSGVVMQWYGSIEASGTPSWTGLVPNTIYTLNSDVSVTYVSNGNFTKSAMASGSWSRAGGGTAATLTDSDNLTANQFALKANESTTEPGETQRLISGTYRTIGTGSQTDENPTPETTGLWLKLGEPFLQGTYTGTIYFQISNP